MKIVIWLDGIPQGLAPSQAVQDLRLKYETWTGSPVASQVQLGDVDPKSVPDVLPDYMDLIE